MLFNLTKYIMCIFRHLVPRSKAVGKPQKFSETRNMQVLHFLRLYRVNIFKIRDIITTIAIVFLLGM